MINRSKYKKMFIDEALENIDLINNTLAAPSIEEQSAIQTLFRAFHSIKGMAASMNYSQIQEVSHRLEDLLDGLRSQKIVYNKEILDVLYDASSILEKMVRVLEDDSDEKIDIVPLMNSLALASTNAPSGGADPSASPTPKKKEGSAELRQKDLAELSQEGNFKYKIQITISNDSISPPARAFLLLESLREKSAALKTNPDFGEIEKGKIGREFEVYLDTELAQAEIESLIRSSVEIEKCSVSTIEIASSERTGDPERLVKREPSTEEKNTALRYRKPGAVKVDTPVLDRLINIVGQMFIQENLLRDIARRVKSPETVASVNELEKLVKKLYKEVMTIRMVPISLLTDIIPRVMHETLRNSPKRVELAVSGKQIKLDRSIIEKLGDPVIHLIRNCLDHGIEDPHERTQAGKSETAKLTFAATKEKDSIKIEISDDGRGLNPHKIKEKIIAGGFAKEGTIKKADLTEIYSYIWKPGFSTSQKVTSISGRGVGMDIVQNVVEGLGGKVLVTSTPGQGCAIHLQVPLTIAIIKTFRIRLDRDVYAIPIGRVLHTINVPKRNFNASDDEGAHFFYRKEKIPVKDLRTILQYEKKSLGNNKSIPVIVVEVGGYNKIGLIVDSFLNVFDTVVKSLAKPLERLEVFSGATISEKGEMILVLDVDKLFYTKRSIESTAMV